MVLDDLAQLLQANNLGTLGTNLWLGQLADGVGVPDASTALVETGGLGPVFAHDANGINYEQPGVQVIVRGVQHDYETPRATAQDIFILFGSVFNTKLSGTDYLWIRPQQAPFSLGKDDNHRPRIVCNFIAAKALLADTGLGIQQLGTSSLGET